MDRTELTDRLRYRGSTFNLSAARTSDWRGTAGYAWIVPFCLSLFLPFQSSDKVIGNESRHVEVVLRNRRFKHWLMPIIMLIKKIIYFWYSCIHTHLSIFLTKIDFYQTYLFVLLQFCKSCILEIYFLFPICWKLSYKIRKEVIPFIINVDCGVKVKIRFLKTSWIYFDSILIDCEFSDISGLDRIRYRSVGCSTKLRLLKYSLW